ncbi:MAG: hypothetical protein HRF46_00340 [Acidobacteriota bacterium]|jgi:hypothetical protein
MIDKRFPHAYSTVLAVLQGRLAGPAPGRVQLLSGPGQVGKIHLLGALLQAAADVTVYGAGDSAGAGVAACSWMQFLLEGPPP